MSKTSKKNASEIGKYYEDIALQYLSSKGFNLIAKNFYSCYGEIDLIMYKDNILHFIEVKSSKFMNPLFKITPNKMDKLIKTIHIFLMQYDYPYNFCIDALGIYKDTICFIENITMN